MIKKNIKDCDMQELLGIIKQYNHLVRNRVVVPQKYHELVKAVREEIDKRYKGQKEKKLKYCQNCKCSEFKNTANGIRLWCDNKKTYVGFWDEICKGEE